MFEINDTIVRYYYCIVFIYRFIFLFICSLFYNLCHIQYTLTHLTVDDKMVDAKNLKTPKQRLSDVATWNANNFNSAGYNNNNSNNINSNNNNNNHIGKSDYKADLSKNRADYLNNASDYNTIDNKTDHIGHHIGTGILSEISTPENTVRKPINIVLSDAQSRVNTIDNLRNKLGTIKLNQQNGT